MFQKPFRIKSNTSIKGSDRKKLRADLGKLYPCLSTEILAQLVPNKEDMTTMKIYSHAGQTITVYCLHNNPIFFDVDRVIYPTVYTLWKYPELLPSFTTWPPVFTKLAGGADLMLPGIVVHGGVTQQTLGNLAKGQPCAVNLLGNRAPVAVGKTALSSSDMYESAMKGKGVHILHIYQDHLWAHGDKSDPPLIEHQSSVNAELQTDGTDDVITQDHVQSVAETQTDNGATQTETDRGATQIDTDSSNNINNRSEKSDERLLDMESLSICENTEVSNNACAGSDTVTAATEEPMSQEDMDSLLYTCFLCSVKSNVKKSDLPLLTSKFFKAHLQVWCPKDKAIDIKKSSYKKLSKFLMAMQKEDFIKLKALSPGVDSIISINKDHPQLRSFQLPELPEETPLESSSSTSGYQPPEIVEMHSVTADMLSFFQPFGYKKGSPLTSSQLREHVTEYIKANELQNNVFVTIDPILHDICANRGEHLEQLRWDDLLNRISTKMGACHAVTFPGCTTQVKKGKISPIVFNVVTRSGNKKVTLVENLETFGINPQEFAHTVQLAVACSSSVAPLPGKGRGVQVTIQGNQINFVADLLLDKYKIPRKYMEGLQKAPKSGKKR